VALKENRQKKTVLVGETSRRAAFFLASLSVAVCVLGSVRAIATVRANLTEYNRPDTIALAWMAVPLTLAITGMIATLSCWIGPIWVCTGALFGFVVLGAWSLGLFYVYGALVMLAAALIHLLAVRAGWRTLVAPIWMLAGVGGLSAAFFVLDDFRNTEYLHVTHAPIVVWGSWLFVTVCPLLLIVYGLLAVRRPIS
jgi:hypothetical protein